MKLSTAIRPNGTRCLSIRATDVDDVYQLALLSAECTKTGVIFETTKGPEGDCLELFLVFVQDFSGRRMDQC